jgi:hypothetical protein
MKIFTLSFAFMLFGLSAYVIPYYFPIFAQQNSNEIFIDVEPPSYSFVKNVGSSEKLYNNVRSNKKQVFAQAFDWNKRSKNLEFSYSDWFRPKSKTINITPPTPATHSYTLNIPSETNPGEYLKLITYSNKPYTCEENYDSPVMVGVPINTLVVQGVNITDQASSKDELKKLLASNLVVTGFRSFFSIFNMSQEFDFNISNDGNIQAFYNGYILIKNQAGETIEKLGFDNGVYPLEAQKSESRKLTFDQSKQLIGSYKAELYLGYRDTLHEHNPKLIDTIQFNFIGIYLILDFIKVYLLFIMVFFIANQLIPLFKQPKMRMRYVTANLIILAVLPATIYSIYQFSQSEDVKGAVNSGKESVNVTAVVRESTAIRVSDANGIKLVKIVSHNSHKGWELWSFNCTSTRLLATDQSFKDNPNPEFQIDEESSKLPLLLIARFF